MLLAHSLSVPRESYTPTERETPAVTCEQLDFPVTRSRVLPAGTIIRQLGSIGRFIDGFGDARCVIGRLLRRRHPETAVCRPQTNDLAIDPLRHSYAIAATTQNQPIRTHLSPCCIPHTTGVAQKLRQSLPAPHSQRIVVAARKEPIRATVPHAQNKRVFLFTLGVSVPSRDHVWSRFAAEPRDSLAVVGDQFPVVSARNEADEFRGVVECDGLGIYVSRGTRALRCVRSAQQRMLA